MDFTIEVHELTDFDSVPTKEKAGENHLSQSKSRAESGEEADGDYTKNVDEEDDQYCINESKIKHWVCERADCEGRNNHVCGEPL